MQQFFSQTYGVAILSLVKLLERFSYYGMRALIVLYAVDELGIDRSDSLTYYGIFTAAIYLVNIPMNLITDLLLKQKRGILSGFIFLVIGYFVLVIPDKMATIGGLFLIVIGTGFINANMIVLLGRQFKKQDKKRNQGFITFVVAINIGAFFASLVLGYIGETYGYKYGFGIAGLSAIMSLVIFLVSMNRFNLIELDNFSKPQSLEDNHPEILDYNPNSKNAMAAVPPPIPGYRGNESIIGRHLMIIGITLVTMLFWQMYEISSYQLFQMFGRGAEINIFGISLPGSFLYSAQLIFFLPLCVVLFVLMVNGKAKSSINMIGVGFLALALNFGLTHIGTGDADLFSLLTLGGSFLAISLAEIFITAIALSYMTRLNNVRFASTVIGLYLLLVGIGGRLFSFMQTYYLDVNLLVLAIIPVLIGLVFILGRKLMLQLSGGLD